MKTQIWTIPNIITIIRLLMLPVFVYVANHNLIAGAIMVGILAATDRLDGEIARRFNQESKLGRILDPIADRTLVLTSFICFYLLGALPILFVVIIGLRELLVSIGTLLVAKQNKIRLNVNNAGKVSAFGAMFATPTWVFANETTGVVQNIWLSLALFSTIVAAITGYYSIFLYIKVYRALKIN